MFSLAGKTAVVTGGGGVLCSIIGSAFAKAGANVILWDIRQEGLDEKVKVLAQACGDPTRVSSVKVDLLNEDSVKQALEKSVSLYGKVDILLNGAGGNKGKAFLTEAKIEDVEFVLKLNLLAGCIIPSKHFTSYWIKNKVKGAIINIASMAGLNPLSEVYGYSMAKAAVINQTVNSIAPGFFIADQNRALLLNPDGSLTARGKAVIAHTPYGRFGEPDELSGACIFLASDNAAGFVSGINIAIDGAYMAFNI